MTDSSTQTALILMIVGIFVFFLGWINVCLHFQSTDPDTKRWAIFSIVIAILQIFSFGGYLVF